MLSHSLHRLGEAVLLKAARGDAIRADELRVKITGRLLTFMMITYVPLMVAVIVVSLHRPVVVDQVALQDRETAVKAWSVRYVNTYLRDPSDGAAIRQFYDGEVPASALPLGGRAIQASSLLPGVSIDGFQAWSVVVDSAIPKAANSVSMVYVPLQVDVAVNRRGLLRAFTLPHARPDRQPGQPVELATQFGVSEDCPLYKTVNGFLSAMLIGQGELQPYVAAGSSLRAAQPPRFTTMAIERVQADSDSANAQNVPAKADGVEVTVRAVMQTASGVLMPMDFPLVMSVAAGHWQVDRINDAPSIIAPAGSADSEPSNPATPSSSTARSVPITVKGS